jgi:hypothetical protein
MNSLVAEILAGFLQTSGQSGANWRQWLLLREKAPPGVGRMALDQAFAVLISAP